MRPRALLFWGVQGNIGDRDNFVYDGYNFGVIEGQFTQGNFGTWRTFIYDYQTGNAEQLYIATHNGSTAFANPTVTIMNINGVPAMVVTLFVPSEGAANGEAGELMYYRFLNNPSVGINTPIIENDLNLYPNPAADILFVERKNGMQKETVQIFNNGQLLYEDTNFTATSIDLSALH